MIAKFANYLLELWKLEKDEETKWRYVLSLLLFDLAQFKNVKLNICFIRLYFKMPCIFLLRTMFFVSGFYKLKIVDRGMKRAFLRFVQKPTLVLFKGGPNDEEEARLLVVAPHTSPFDLLVGISLVCPSVVARHDSTEIPFFGSESSHRNKFI